MADLTGLEFIAQGPSWTDQALDIIAIHGLQGYDTWKHPAHGVEDNSRAVFWVKDFLPSDFPSAKIYTYRYLSTAFRDDKAINKAADKLLSKLKGLQEDNIQRSRPLVFICHSVGGLILQCALNKAFDKKGEKALDDIITATQGIIFLGTPHSNPDLGTSLARIAAASETTESIMFDTQFLAQVLVRFAGLSQYNLPWKIVHCYEELPLPGTTFRAVEPSQEESWALPQLSLYSHHIDLPRFRSQHDVSYIKVLQSLKNITSGLGSSVVDEIEVQRTLSSVEHEVFESLEVEDTSANIQTAAPGTCDWILNHDTYKSWLDKPSPPLFLTGKGGAGKTILSKHIIESLSLKQTTSSSSAVVFYFFSPNGENDSVESLLSSLLHQLLKTTPSIRSFELFTKFHERREDETSDSVRDVDILLESLLLLVDKSTAKGDSLFFIIDALDECKDPDKLDTVLRHLNNFNPGRKLWICTSSRTRNISVPCAEIRLEDNNSPDIQRYIGESLLGLGSHLSLNSDVEETTQALAEEAKGIFLWAVLAISQIRYDVYFETTKSKQHTPFWIPATLDAAYETIIQKLWDRHDETRRGMARDAFTLVLCAQRPLSVLELRSALASMHYDSHLLSPLSKSEVNDWGIWNKMDKIHNQGSLDVCTQLMLLFGGLLEVAPRQTKFANDMTDTDFTVHFIHRTARDFLLEKGSCVLDYNHCRSKLSFPEHQFSDFQLCEAQYHFQTAWICLVYVDHTYKRCDRLNTESAMKSALFLEYSISFGMEHLRLAEMAGVNPMSEKMCWLPAFQKGFVDHWSLLHSRALKEQRVFEPHKTKAVHLMSYYGLPWHETGIWGANLAEINEEDHHGQTPLSLAAAMGHHHILEMLLDNGADIGHRDCIYGQTPLGQAAGCGHKEVVELLTRKGADYDDNSNGATPLWYAISIGQLDIAKLLLQAGADPNASSIHTGETCLSLAASFGHTRAASMLLEHGAEVDTRDRNGWTPLHHAVSQGRKKMIQVLLGAFKSQELFQLKDRLFKDKSRSSWVNTVLMAIVILACYERGGERQTVSSQNSQALPHTCSDGRVLRNQGRKPQKHKLGAESDEDDNEENPEGNSEKRRRRSEPFGDRFACPYHKKNWAKFSSGPCNGKGFENIDRLKSHLKASHNRSIDFRRCHFCKKRFRREELDGHGPCERRDLGDDYEDGYDLDQAQDLRSDRTRPSKNPPESCWKAIFRVLFPTWPANQDTPNPYQANTVSTYYADAIQQHRNRVMGQNTISELYACQSEDEIRQLLEVLIGDLERNFGHTPITTNSVPPRPLSAMSPQPTIVVNTQPPPHQPPPVSRPTRAHNHSRRHRLQLHTPAVSSSDANSSRLLQSLDPSDTFTDCTAFSDQMSMGLDSLESYQVMNGSNNLTQFNNTEMTITVAQQPMGNMDHHPAPDFATENEVTSLDDWSNFLHDPQHQPQPVGGDLVQNDLQPGDYDENKMPSMAP